MVVWLPAGLTIVVVVAIISRARAGSLRLFGSLLTITILPLVSLKGFYPAWRNLTPVATLVLSSSLLFSRLFLGERRRQRWVEVIKTRNKRAVSLK